MISSQEQDGENVQRIERSQAGEHANGNGGELVVVQIAVNHVKVKLIKR